MNNDKSFKLVSWGKERWESTAEFINRVAAIKQEVKEEYAGWLEIEKNLLKKLWIQILILVEIRRRIERISSHKNLHLSIT
ncbi:hypothetical protein L0244_33485 [bacterium]|nr:hypothetical protein [bacterium]